jgi:hypothetical protein
VTSQCSGSYLSAVGNSPFTFANTQVYFAYSERAITYSAKTERLRSHLHWSLFPINLKYGISTNERLVEVFSVNHTNTIFKIASLLLMGKSIATSGLILHRGYYSDVAIEEVLVFLDSSIHLKSLCMILVPSSM